MDATLRAGCKTTGSWNIRVVRKFPRCYSMFTGDRWSSVSFLTVLAVNCMRVCTRACVWVHRYSLCKSRALNGSVLLTCAVTKKVSSRIVHFERLHLPFSSWDSGRRAVHRAFNHVYAWTFDVSWHSWWNGYSESPLFLLCRSLLLTPLV